MDPLSGVSLAAAVVQFVDFGSKIISAAQEIHHSASGASLENSEIEKVTHRLFELCSKLEKSLNQDSRGQFVSLNEFEIAHIGQDCTQVGSELLEELGKLKLAGKSGRWRSLRQALATHWGKERVDTLERRLQRFRQDLIPHLLGTIREQVQVTNRSQCAAQQYNRGIGEIFLSYVDESRRWREDLLDALHRAQNVPDDITLGIFSVPFDDSETTIRLGKQIISRLRFSGMEDRHGRIADAYQRTFEWIFHDPTAEQKPWASFIQWLQNGSGLYWITGKAGSGKSTLMKYLYRDPRLWNFLNTWAAGDELVTAAFFFWNSGTKMQMSEAGMLRTLLYQILDRLPNAINSLFPERWERFNLFRWDNEEFTKSELHAALKALQNFDTKNVKFCFFIDGLDEFEGKHAELIRLLGEIVSSPNIKACVASRPLIIFEEAFAKGPSLRLQDLTRPDIELFVNEKFHSYNIFVEVRQHDEKAAQHLIRNITKKASGVFLWVHLVVESLLEGLSSGDRPADLQRRLDDIPQDLEELFRKILDSLDPSYLEHASQLFQLVRAAIEPPSLLCLSFADEQDPDMAVNANIAPVSREDALYRAKMMRRRLNSRCKGLLEVGDEHSQDLDRKNLMSRHQSQGHHADNKTSESSRVQYLHRTVKDYLERKDVWGRLLAATSTPFDPNLSLSRSFLFQLKTSDRIKLHSVLFWSMILSCIIHASVVGYYDNTSKVLEELQRVASELDPPPGVHSQYGFCSLSEGFLELASFCHFDTFVKRQLESTNVRRLLASNHKKRHHGFTKSALFLALREESPGRIDEYSFSHLRAWVKKSYGTPSSECIKLLLEHGADPNESNNAPTGTLWEDIVEVRLNEIRSLARSTSADDHKLCREWLLIIAAFLRHGARRSHDIDRILEIKLIDDSIIQHLCQKELDDIAGLLKAKAKKGSKRFNFRKLYSR